MLENSIGREFPIEITADERTVISSALGALLAASPRTGENFHVEIDSVLKKMDGMPSVPGPITLSKKECAAIISGCRSLPQQYAESRSTVIDDFIMKFPSD
jgi:hypothetical protein